MAAETHTKLRAFLVRSDNCYHLAEYDGLVEQLEAVTTDRDICLQNFETGARVNQRLEEQLEATRTALRDLLKESEPRDHKWAVQGGTRPGDCVFCRAHVALGGVSIPASEPKEDA